MSSTRSKNDINDYNLKQQEISAYNNYHNYTHQSAGSAYNHALPGNGFGNISMPITELIYNSIDIDTQLKGIGANNLIVQPKTYTPQQKSLNTLHSFEKPKVLMPMDKSHTFTQNRPFFM